MLWPINSRFRERGGPTIQKTSLQKKTRKKQKNKTKQNKTKTLRNSNAGEIGRNYVQARN